MRTIKDEDFEDSLCAKDGTAKIKIDLNTKEITHPPSTTFVRPESIRST